VRVRACECLSVYVLIRLRGRLLLPRRPSQLLTVRCGGTRAGGSERCDRLPPRVQATELSYCPSRRCPRESHTKTADVARWSHSPAVHCWDLLMEGAVWLCCLCCPSSAASMLGWARKGWGNEEKKERGNNKHNTTHSFSTSLRRRRRCRYASANTVTCRQLSSSSSPSRTSQPPTPCRIVFTRLKARSLPEHG
jgi:hypothetical protein